MTGTTTTTTIAAKTNIISAIKIAAIEIEIDRSEIIVDFADGLFNRKICD